MNAFLRICLLILLIVMLSTKLTIFLLSAGLSVASIGINKLSLPRLR